MNSKADGRLLDEVEEVIAFQHSKTTAFSEKQSSDDELFCLLIFLRNQNTLAVRCRRKSSVNTVTATANPSQGLQGTEKLIKP